MKLSIILVMVNILAATAAGYSQDTRLSLDMRDVSLKDVLAEIETQTDLSFIFKSDLLNTEQKVDIQASDAPIEQVLAYLFDEQNIRCQILDNSLIVLLPKVTEKQQQNVTGTITDAVTGESLMGVNVLIEGTGQGVITDLQGHYSVDVPGPSAALVFSYIGYTTHREEVGTRATIDVKLEPDVTSFEEVVVVGYGTTRKATATGSVTTAKGVDIIRSPATNVTNTLIGRLPGVVAVTRSGEPGYDNSTLRVRGTNTLGDNSALVVVDGIANRKMERIDPSDIESITVLKDASAAIYGAQAANGVILITTKRGKIGKPKITFTVNGGVNRPTRIPEMANAFQYASMLNEIDIYRGRDPRYSDEDLNLFANGEDPWGHPSTDWFDEVFKKWSNQNYENVSVSGGTENMRYYLSFGHKFQDAVYKHSATNYRQYDFRSNIDGKISDNIDIAFDISGRQENKNFPTVSAGDSFRMIMRGKPNMPAYWPDGTPGPDIEYGHNPAVTVTDATGYDKDRWYILESNVRMNAKIPWLEGLVLTGNVSFDKAFRYHKRFRQPWYLYTWDGNEEHTLEKGKRGLDAPELYQETQDGYKITWNVYATYEKSLADNHNIKFMVGTERQQGYNDYMTAFRKNYISTAVDQLFAGAVDAYLNNNGFADQNARMNYFGRVNYDFGQKYMAEFVWRYDGSYMFPKGKQFGFFPALSLGWRLSEENFWKNSLSYINNFKLRASWGQTGNDRIKEYQYLSSYGYYTLGMRDNSSDQTPIYYDFDINQQNKMLYESRIPNPNVTWEVANQTNLGFESMIGNRVTVEFDYFVNKRSEILWRRNASVPGTAGLTLPPENLCKVTNRGFEYVVGYRGSYGEFQYDVSTNGGYSKNEITYWDETPGRPDYQQSTGHSIPTDPNDLNSDLYYESIGVFDDEADVDSYPHWAGARPGDIIFKDVNKDGVIDGLDRVRSNRNNLPRFVGGLSLNLRYKQFDAAILIQGAAGGQQYINPESGEIGNFYKDFADNRWTEDNPGSDYPRTWNRDEEYWRANANTHELFLRRTDYVRLKNIEIGYNLPASFNRKLGIDGLRIYINGLNLLTVDKVKLIDPELEQGTSYPLSKIINGGLTLTF